MLGEIKGRRRRAHRGRRGHHWLSGHEFEQTLGDREGQGSLACCSPWGHKGPDSTNWTTLSPTPLQTDLMTPAWLLLSRSRMGSMQPVSDASSVLIPASQQPSQKAAPSCLRCRLPHPARTHTSCSSRLLLRAPSWPLSLTPPLLSDCHWGHLQGLLWVASPFSLHILSGSSHPPCLQALNALYLTPGSISPAFICWNSRFLDLIDRAAQMPKRDVRLQKAEFSLCPRPLPAACSLLPLLHLSSHHSNTHRDFQARNPGVFVASPLSSVPAWILSESYLIPYFACTSAP